MEYSKIATIELINFMSFKHAKLSFDDTGILNLKGYNDSGKSTVLRAVAVCLMDMFKRNQVKFIRHGEEYFRVIVTFDDGVAIVKDKYLNGQTLFEVYKEKDLIYTSKQGNRLSKIDDIPVEIQNYLGLCMTDGSYLNYQSCSDKLPFVDTSGSDNYQMFHEVLRAEEIYKATRMINDDKCLIGQDICSMEDDMERDRVLLNRCGDVSQELIDKLSILEKISATNNNKKEHLDSSLSILNSYNSIPNIPSIDKVSFDRYGSISSIKGILEELDKQPNIPKVEKVSSERLGGIDELLDIVNNIEKTPYIPKVDIVDGSRLSNLTSIKTLLEVDIPNEIPAMSKVDGDRLGTLSSIVSILDGLSSIKNIPSISVIDSSYIDKKKQLDSIGDIYNTLYSYSVNGEEINTNIDNLREELNALVKSAKDSGLNIIKCNNCGEYTVAGGECNGE